jgi:hypothetical protein
LFYEDSDSHGLKPPDYRLIFHPKPNILAGLALVGRSYPTTASNCPLAWYKFAKAISENTCAAFLAKPL